MKQLEAETKLCCTCGCVKSATEFNRCSRSGLQSKCRSCQRVARKAWANASRDYRARKQREYIQRYPAKKKAHRRVETALANGTLKRPDVCERCNAGGRIEAHHPDYSQPLAVVWLCRACHTVLHREDAA